MPRKPDYRVILGVTIRQQRKWAELTLEALAEKAELHPHFLGRVELGDKHAYVIILYRLAETLKPRVRDLVVKISNTAARR